MCIIEDFIKQNGVTLCAPAKAQGADMSDVHRRHVTKTRAAFAAEHGIRLKDGSVSNVGRELGA